jgi:uncharacterized membrane protein YcaP (DUF421 family)
MSVMHGIERIGQVKYDVLERDGQIRVVPSRGALDGVVPVAHRDRDGVDAGRIGPGDT